MGTTETPVFWDVDYKQPVRRQYIPPKDQQTSARLHGVTF
jgi:hypothetical protein